MQINIIKIGGNVIDNPGHLDLFLEKFASIKGYKILVHGGGKIATKIAKQLGVDSLLIEGRRVTDAAMRDVVTMVYGGLINKQIVAKLQSKKCNAIGLTGADGGIILAHKRPIKSIDYGYVGDIESVNNDLINSLLNLNLTPIFAPLTFDIEGDILNTNADTQATQIAISLAKNLEVSLIFCFEKKGVLLDPQNDESVITKLTKDIYQTYKNEGIIYEGMIPKLDNAFLALKNGVKKIIICHSNDISEAIIATNIGTTITND